MLAINAEFDRRLKLTEDKGTGMGEGRAGGFLNYAEVQRMAAPCLLKDGENEYAGPEGRKEMAARARCVERDRCMCWIKIRKKDELECAADSDRCL